jgi:Tol biopolymer transport system component
MLSVPPGSAGAQTTEERILYTDRTAPSRPTLFSIRPDGTGLRKELRGADQAALSPDGSAMAFVKLVGNRKNGSSEIFVQVFGERKPTQLTDDPGNDASPDWAPDGSQIVWARDNTIWVMNADGSDEHALRTGSDGSGPVVEGNTPAWSHDGTRIAYFDQRGSGPGTFDIFVFELSTGTETQLTDDSGQADDDKNPQWSPSDGEIVFARRPAGSINDEIWAMAADGSGEHVVFADSAGGRDASDPVFAPGGSEIAFECDLNGDFDRDICRMDADGTNAQTVTPSGHNFAPDWGLMAA